jgi:hypothetical protein
MDMETSVALQVLGSNGPHIIGAHPTTNQAISVVWPKVEKGFSADIFSGRVAPLNANLDAALLTR